MLPTGGHLMSTRRGRKVIAARVERIKRRLLKGARAMSYEDREENPPRPPSPGINPRAARTRHPTSPTAVLGRLG